MDDASNHNEREEGVLKDVLEELDRERSRRAELEEQLRKLQEETEAVATQRALEASKPAAEVESIPHDVFVSMETQVAGYQQLVDALTMGKPAIAAAAAAQDVASLNSKGAKPKQLSNPNLHSQRKTLPLHVVRLLEVLPWDPRAKQHIFAVEEIFEWQVYRDKAWQSHMRYFPTMFKTLRLVKSPSKLRAEDRMMDELSAVGSLGSRNKKDRSLLQFLAGSGEGHVSTPVLPRRKGKNKSRVITNERVTSLYDMDAGYPLPKNNGGVWEWVGGWRVCKRITPTEEEDEAAHKKVDCDEYGWSYVTEPQDFLVGNDDLIWDNPGVEDDDTPTNSSTEGSKGVLPARKYRRRRWTRQRVLVDYLYASKSTQQYLKLLVENAELSVTANKTSEQLIETKTALTEAEASLVEARELLRQKDEALKAAGIATNHPTDIMQTPSKKVDELGIDSMRSVYSNDSKNTELSGRSDSGKDFGAKLSQLFQSAARKTSEDMTSVDESLEEIAFLDGSGHGGSGANGSTQELPQQGDKFDWKKIGRGHLVNRFKQSQATSNSNRPQHNRSGSARSIFRKNSSPTVNDEPAKASASKD